MKKTDTCMKIVGADSREAIYTMMLKSLSNNDKTIRKCFGEDTTIYADEYVEIPYLIFFKKKERIVIPQHSPEYAVALEKSIDRYVINSEFHYRARERLRRLDKFITYSYKNSIDYDLSASDYEYLRLWCEEPNSRHTIYNSALY